jgi:hypothetical protein
MTANSTDIIKQRDSHVGIYSDDSCAATTPHYCWNKMPQNPKRTWSSALSGRHRQHISSDLNVGVSLVGNEVPPLPFRGRVEIVKFLLVVQAVERDASADLGRINEIEWIITEDVSIIQSAVSLRGVNRVEIVCQGGTVEAIKGHRRLFLRDKDKGSDTLYRIRCHGSIEVTDVVGVEMVDDSWVILPIER